MSKGVTSAGLPPVPFACGVTTHYCDTDGCGWYVQTEQKPVTCGNCGLSLGNRVSGVCDPTKLATNAK